MTTIPTTADRPIHAAEPHHGGNYLNHAAGFRSWLFTLDHKRIGVMYLAAILFSFLLGGIFALLVRTELLTPGRTIMTAEDYNRLFTLHGAVMTFLFIIPGIPAALGNFVLPLMLGAKDVALPRLNLASFHIYVVGALLSVAAILLGGVDTGWTFYTPYSTSTGGPVILVTLGVFVLGFSSIFTGINFIVTIHKMRPAGMGWFRMPLMLWALYATAIIQVLATPVLAITLLLLIAERALGIGIFDPALGGDPILFQHFFWFYSHPAVYIMILPAMGVISELVSIHSRKTIFGYKAIAYSSIAIAIFSFLVWGHHMFVSGQSELAVVIFSALTFSVSIPSAVKVFNWLSTMYKGSIKLETPMVYALAFIVLFGIGGLTGLFLATLATDVHLHDTYFVVAHFHYTMVGGVMIAFLAGLYHWWPKLFGRLFSQRWGNVGAVLVFIGFNLTFFAQFVMGAKGMPRRYFNYPPEFEIYHQISTAGSYLLAVGLFVAAGVLVHSLLAGRHAPANPWGGATLEWQAASPPIHHNFDGPLVLTDPYDFSGLVWNDAEQGYDRRDRDKETANP
ncbi:MAG TPA: cytochrome c oxidase subunit I [Candidatus Krumholzibacteria bacterium]|nr:cytochrome c oxidase subunit I [Candidatus Krumholzibacteria bacterium]HPD70717.1 cytochrome c oxidase subunit I [Candidatus Krumholzibacteria bacterium]HRY39583.1 cytochrome c oxidase subunit I [Candidatus Krumholzibacteria bacterium]